MGKNVYFFVISSWYTRTFFEKGPDKTGRFARISAVGRFAGL